MRVFLTISLITVDSYLVESLLFFKRVNQALETCAFKRGWDPCQRLEAEILPAAAGRHCHSERNSAKKKTSPDGKTSAYNSAFTCHLPVNKKDASGYKPSRISPSHRPLPSIYKPFLNPLTKLYKPGAFMRDLQYLSNRESEGGEGESSRDNS